MNTDTTDQDKGGWHAGRSLETKSARQCAEWQLLKADLEYCLRRIELCLATTRSGEGEDSRDVAVSLFRDAVVTFVCCFDKETPVRLDAEKLYDRPNVKGGMEYYSYILGLRNSWIAHRHGAYRRCHTIILVDERNGDFIGHGYGRSFISYTPGENEGMKSMIEIAISYVEYKIGQLEPIIVEEAKSLHPSERLRLPVAATKIPDDRSFVRGRRKYENVNRMTRNEVPIPPDRRKDCAGGNEQERK